MHRAPVVVVAGALLLLGLRPPEAAASEPIRPAQRPAFTVTDIPPSEIESRLGITYEEMLERRAAVTTRAPGDTVKALILLCEWADDQANQVDHPASAYQTLLFSQGVVDPGSMREFFLEDSYGALWIEGDVVGWLQEPTYDPGYWFTDFLAQADDIVDFSDYDGDGDGYTDAVWIFHAGPGQEETHDPDHIWSYAVYGLDWMSDDGVIVDRYSCNPEEHINGDIISIRVPAHEASHVLGLPDLYDYDAKLDTTTYFTPNDANDHPLVDWCLMGYGGYAIMNYGTDQPCPQHHCAWSKKELGWIAPTTISTSQHDVPAPEVQTNAVAYQINKPGSGGNEYFLIENRNTQGASFLFDHLDSDFSAYCPWFTPGRNAKDAGLLIYHVYEYASNNNGSPHYKVIVEDAGYDPSTPWDGVDEYSEEWYPYEFRIGAAYAAEDPGQNKFTPETSPNTSWYSGSSGIWITNIGHSDSVMTFDVGFGNAWPAIVDHRPAALDTTLEGGSFLFSVAVVDEDGDTPSYEWFVNGSSIQATGDSTFLHVAGPPGTVDTVLVVASDGSLADTLSWLVSSGISTGVAEAAPRVKSATLAAWPTPFNPSVTIRADLPAAGEATVTVHDLAGRLVKTLAERVHHDGSLQRTWRGETDRGDAAASGVYFVRVFSGEDALTTKIVLLR